MQVGLLKEQADALLSLQWQRRVWIPNGSTASLFRLQEEVLVRQRQVNEEMLAGARMHLVMYDEVPELHHESNLTRAAARARSVHCGRGNGCRDCGASGGDRGGKGAAEASTGLGGGDAQLGR